MLSELRSNLGNELDFRLEAANAQRLAAAFAGRRGVAVPALVPEVRHLALLLDIPMLSLPPFAKQWCTRLSILSCKFPHILYK